MPARIPTRETPNMREPVKGETEAEQVTVSIYIIDTLFIGFKETVAAYLILPLLQCLILA